MDPTTELFLKFKDLSELKYWISLGMLPLRLLEAKMNHETRMFEQRQIRKNEIVSLFSKRFV